MSEPKEVITGDIRKPIPPPMRIIRDGSEVMVEAKDYDVLKVEYETLLLESEAMKRELDPDRVGSTEWHRRKLKVDLEANAKYRKAWDTLTESLNGYSATYLGNGKSAAKQVLEVMSELMKEKP